MADNIIENIGILYWNTRGQRCSEDIKRTPDLGCLSNWIPIGIDLANKKLEKRKTVARNEGRNDTFLCVHNNGCIRKMGHEMCSDLYFQIKEHLKSRRFLELTLINLRTLRQRDILNACDCKRRCIFEDKCIDICTCEILFCPVEPRTFLILVDLKDFSFNYFWFLERLISKKNKHLTTLTTKQYSERIRKNQRHYFNIALRRWSQNNLNLSRKIFDLLTLNESGLSSQITKCIKVTVFKRRKSKIKPRDGRKNKSKIKSDEEINTKAKDDIQMVKKQPFNEIEMYVNKFFANQMTSNAHENVINLHKNCVNKKENVTQKHESKHNTSSVRCNNNQKQVESKLEDHYIYEKSNDTRPLSPVHLHKGTDNDLTWKEIGDTGKSSISQILFQDNFTPAPVKLWIAPFARSNDHTLEAIFSKFTSATPPTKEETMAFEMLRLCTLHDFPNLNLSYVRLAQAGFYYAGNGDEVICFACGVRKSGWSRDDNPIDVHRQISPNCPFFQNVRLNRPVLYAEDVASQNYLLDTPSGFTRESNDVPPRGGRNEIDVARPHDSGSYTLENTVVKTLNGAGRDSGYGTYSGSDLAVDNSVATDHDRQRGRDRFPQYSTYENRLETYKNWPSHLRQNPRELAQAGLFFTNDRDLVKCFRCGTGLYDWQWDDNPWIEHTRLSQECSFIIEVKGQKFIRTVLEAAAEAERREQGDNGNRLSTESRAPRSSSSNASQSQSSSTTSATNNAQKSRTPESTSSGSQSQSSSRTAATNNAQKSRTPESTSSGSQSKSSSRTAATNNAPYDERSTNNQMPSRALRTNTVSNIHTKTSAILADNNTENNTTTNETRNTGSNDRHNFSDTNNQKSASATSVSTASALPNDRRTFGSSTEENASNQNSVAEASSDAASSSQRAVTGASNGSLSPDLTNDNNSSSALSNGHVDSTSESDHKQSKKAKKKSRNKKSSKHSPEDTSSATSPELNGLDHASNHEEHEESGSSGQSIASRLPEDAENTDPKTLKKQIKEMKDLTICKICLDNKVSVVFLPCGHLVACKQCSRSLRKCPICRKNIKKTVDTQI